MTKTERFRPFRVTAKIRESETITSFHLAASDAAQWIGFEAGQYLTIRVPDGDSFQLRNYTISSSPRERGTYRITVKREAAPAADQPDGLSSCWLHDQVGIGAELMIDGPHGVFRLDSTDTRPVILLSAGVGLTPTVAMLKILASESSRPVWFIHACEHGGVHALRDEVEQLAALRDNIHVHFCYRRPRAGDQSHSQGPLSIQDLQQMLPLDDYQVYMCGPKRFMQAMYDLLTGLGIAEQRIDYEFFGPASRLKRSLLAEPVPQPVAASPEAGTGDVQVRLQKSGMTLAWDDKAPSLLDFLENNGFEPEFSCRAGICGSCSQTLLSGTVSYFEEPLDEPAQGSILLCCTRPNSSILLDL